MGIRMLSFRMRAGVVLSMLIISLGLNVSTALCQQNGGGMKHMEEHRRPLFRENLLMPKVSGYEVLTCDFHMHTVFSDGSVWPSIRNQEVWEEGLDAYAITDHIEYTPHKEDVRVAHNRGYELLKDEAAKRGLILVKGTEVTRNTPPGHFNAIYIGDASQYIEDRKTNEFDRAAVMKAAEQDAFIFWNHPGWQPKIEGSYEWIDFVADLHENKALHGIEVANGFHLHLKALDWCVDKGLTVMGTSDVHNLVAHDYDMSKRYIQRTMTLVMAKERTPEAIREALDKGRTVAWASKYLLGKEEHVRTIFNASVKVSPSHFKEVKNNGKAVYYHQISNNSDLYFEMNLVSGEGTEQIVLYPRSSQLIAVPEGTSSLTYEVVSTYIRSDKHLRVQLAL